MKKKKTLEQIYFKLPVYLQNMVVSAYGYRLNKMQYGGDYKSFFNQILKNITLDKDDIYSLQLQKLKHLISLCERYVPYYRNNFKKYSLELDKIKSLDDLRRFPLLEKEQLRLNPSAFINEQYKSNEILCINTSGTTGTPLKIYYNPSARQMNYAFYDRFLSMANIRYGGRKATFGGRLIVPQNQHKPPFWRFNRFQKNLMFSTYHMKAENLLSYIQQLKVYSPDYIEAYPSTISILAKFLVDNNIDGSNITKAVVTSAETLRTDQRIVIESAFCVPVIDQYGSAEMAAFIGQCQEGRYHVHMDYGIIEFLRSDGTAAKIGEEAEIVCTGFVNPVMPMIRYKMDDKCIYSNQPCKCGLQFPVVEKILGRIDDAIVTPDGRSVSRFGAVLYGLPVKEVQYEQQHTGQLIVKIIQDLRFTEETEKIIEKALRDRLGDEIKIQFKHVDSIDRGPGGKLKTIVSKL